MVNPSRNRVSGYVTSADRKMSKGAPSRIWAVSLPDELLIRSHWTPVLRVNSEVSSSAANYILAETATVNLSALFSLQDRPSKSREPSNPLNTTLIGKEAFMSHRFIAKIQEPQYFFQVQGQNEQKSGRQLPGQDTVIVKS